MNSTNTVGFTADTPDHLVIDAGAVYKNYGLANEALIGATSGGCEFDIKTKIFNPKIDSIPDGAVKGCSRIIGIDVTLKVNFIEVTSDVLKMALMADVDTTSNPDYDIITGRKTIKTTDYIDNIALVGKVSGSLKPLIIIVKNVLSSDGIKFSNKDASDNTIPVTFTASTDPNDVNASPYEIRSPKVGATAPFYMATNPIVDSGKIRLDFNGDAASTIPFTGFTASVNGSSDVVTAAVRDANDLSVVKLTLTTAPTAGQVVTISYTQPTLDANRVKSAIGGTLDTFSIVNVINN